MGEREVLLEYMRTFAAPEGWSMRALFAAFEAAMAFDMTPDVRLHRETIVRAESWNVRADVICPSAPGPWPVIVYLHGGGWTTGSPEGYRRVSYELARRGAVVVAPDYRRAPRHRFPAGLDDCRRTLQWAAQNAGRFGGNPENLVLLGDSAGANLAAACVYDGASTVPSRIVLAYGIFDFHAALPLLGEIAGGPSASEQLYLPAHEFESLRHDPQVSPLYGASPWPETLLVVGDRDPLIEQTRSLAKRRRELGEKPTLVIFGETPHGFLQLPFLDAHDAAHASIRRFLTSGTA